MASGSFNGLLAQPHLWHQAVGAAGGGSGTVVSSDLHGWWATYYLHRDFRRLAASVVHCPVTMASLPEDADRPESGDVLLDRHRAPAYRSPLRPRQSFVRDGVPAPR